MSRKGKDSGIGLDTSVSPPNSEPSLTPPSEEEEDINHPDVLPVDDLINQLQQLPQLQPIPPLVNMAQANVTVSGSQINQLPEFDGSDGSDIDIWISHVERCQGQFGWTDKVTCASAKGRMKKDAAYWLHSQKLSGNDFIDWIPFPGQAAVAAAPNAVPPVAAIVQEAARPDMSLREHLKLRFKITITALAAADAVTNLVQKKSENVNGFYDRVVVAVDKKNFSYSDADKAQPEYRRRFLVDVFVFFHAGLSSRIKSRATGGTNPPTSAADLLKAAMEAESFFKRQDLKNESVSEISQEDVEAFTIWRRGFKSGQTPKSSSPPKQGQNQSQGGSSSSGGSKKNIRCFSCNKWGHYANECDKKGQNKAKPQPPKAVKVYEMVQEKEEPSENYNGSYQ